MTGAAQENKNQRNMRTTHPARPRVLVGEPDRESTPASGDRARSGEQSGRPHTAAAHDAGSASGGSE